MFRTLGVYLLLVIPLSLQPPPSPQDVPAPSAYSVDEARKVLRAIDQIRAESPQPWTGPLREVAITESELNSYIAYRIEHEREEIMKVLKLKLFAGNRVEGVAHVDLRGQKVPSFIKPEMDIFFAADLAVSNQAVRISLKKLFVGNEPIQPFIIDTIMAISAALDKRESRSLNDWYELPYGIKNVEFLKGMALIYY